MTQITPSSFAIRFLKGFIFCYIILGMLPGLLRADTTYIYTGNAYNSCTGPYGNGTGCTGALSVTFDVKSGTLLDNLIPLTDITADISSFSFTDGVLLTPITNANALANFSVGTDANGAIISWSIQVNTNFDPQSNQYQETTTSSGFGNLDETDINQPAGNNRIAYGLIQGNPGTWTAQTVTPTPEPATMMLFGTGLLALVKVKRRKFFG